jgi:hypothetical protein
MTKEKPGNRKYRECSKKDCQYHDTDFLHNCDIYRIGEIPQRCMEQDFCYYNKKKEEN